MACAPSLIRVFAVCMRKAWVLSYSLSIQRRLIRLIAQSFCWFCHEAAHMGLEEKPYLALQNGGICTFEPPHDKTNKMIYVPSEDSDQPGICPVWSESSQCARLVVKDPMFLHGDSEDSDQTGRIPRLIGVLTGRTVTLLVLSWRGPFEGLYNTNFHLWFSK